jgi:hypothetical protein
MVFGRIVRGPDLDLASKRAAQKGKSTEPGPPYEGKARETSVECSYIEGGHFCLSEDVASSDVGYPRFDPCA